MTTLLQIGKQAEFSEFFKYQLNDFYVTLASSFSINQNVIDVYNDKNVEFFFQYFVNKALKVRGGIIKIKINNLILKMIIPCLGGCFLLVTLLNSYLIIYIYQVQPNKILNTT